MTTRLPAPPAAAVLPPTVHPVPVRPGTGAGGATPPSTMKVVCAWCGADMGVKDGHGKTGTSHGMCPACQGDFFINDSATAARHINSRRGGHTTVRKHGRDHMSAIGKLGGRPHSPTYSQIIAAVSPNRQQKGVESNMPASGNSHVTGGAAAFRSPCFACPQCVEDAPTGFLTCKLGKTNIPESMPYCAVPEKGAAA